MGYKHIKQLFEQLNETTDPPKIHMDVFGEVRVSQKTIKITFSEQCGNICNIRIQYFGGYYGMPETSYDMSKIVLTKDGKEFMKNCIDMMVIDW